MNTPLTGSINAAIRRHQALIDAGLRVTAIDARYVRLVGVRTDGIALLQILNAAGEDTIDVDRLIAELPNS